MRDKRKNTYKMKKKTINHLSSRFKITYIRILTNNNDNESIE